MSAGAVRHSGQLVSTRQLLSREIRRHNVKRKWLLLIVVVCLMSATAVSAQGSAEITRWVLSGGGGQTTVGTVTLSGSFGQWAVGQTSAGSATLSFLPTVLR
jgi:hypothetical protein